MQVSGNTAKGYPAHTVAGKNKIGIHNKAGLSQDSATRRW